MKTTLELPDTLFRRAKVRASKDGVTLKQFVTEAIREKIDDTSRLNAGEPRWRKHFGAMKEHSKELKRIDAIIEKEFGQVEPALWK